MAVLAVLVTTRSKQSGISLCDSSCGKIEEDTRDEVEDNH